MTNIEKWKSRHSKPRLKIIEIGAVNNIAEVFGCGQSTVSAALAWKSNTERAARIRQYAIDNYTVFYVFGTVPHRKEYPAIAFCQDCKNRQMTTKGDYCTVREAYIRNQKRRCFYKNDGATPANPRIKKLDLIEYPKIWDNLERGEQQEIYRPRTPFWSRKLFGNNTIMYGTAEVRCFKRNNAPLNFHIKDIAVGYGKKEWGGAGKDELVYIIYLGERMEP